VIGSASVGNSCIACITGGKFPTDDYEMDSAIKKEKIKQNEDTLMRRIQLRLQAYSMMTDMKLILT
jgi:hypothetical protein